MTNLNVKRTEKTYEYAVTGDAVNALAYVCSYKRKVSGKGARKFKDAILKAVDSFVENEYKANQERLNKEHEEKRAAFLASDDYKNIDRLALYSAHMSYYGYIGWDYEHSWIDNNELLTGSEVIDDDRIIGIKKVAIKNTDLYRFSIGKGSHVITDRRGMSVEHYITGLTLKEMLLDGMKTYEKLHSVDDYNSWSIKNNKQYLKEMKRAEESSEHPVRKQLFTKDGQEIKHAWMSCKLFNIDKIKQHKEANYEKIVVAKEITVSHASFEKFVKSFNMNDLGTSFEGGTESTYEIGENSLMKLSPVEQDKWCQGAYNLALKVNIEGEDFSLLIDPQGYDYARYCGVVKAGEKL